MYNFKNLVGLHYKNCSKLRISIVLIEHIMIQRRYSYIVVTYFHWWHRRDGIHAFNNDQ